MKRIALVTLALAMLWAMTGCALFDRGTSTVTNHQEQSAAAEDGSILRAESYADLVSCVQHFVSMAQTEGTVHVYKYSGDIASDLDRAVTEVLTEDPLGNFALRDIDFEYSRIVSYYECSFTFDYRRSKAEMATITVAYGDGAIRDLLGERMAAFEDSLTIRTNSYYAESSRIYSLAWQAYYAAPATALGYPQISVHLYPQSGPTRIVEVTFAYDHWDRNVLLRRAESVAAAAADMAGQEDAADGTVAWLLYSRLEDRTNYQPEAGSSVYDALCLTTASSEGLALGYQVLCRQAGIDCRLVQGTLDGEPRWWNIVTLDGVHWLVDVTRADPETDFLHGDEDFLTAGYNWSREDHPPCGDQSQDQQTGQ